MVPWPWVLAGLVLLAALLGVSHRLVYDLGKRVQRAEAADLYRELERGARAAEAVGTLWRRVEGELSQCYRERNAAIMRRP